MPWIDEGAIRGWVNHERTDRRGNWRVTFRFVGEDVTNVNYEDYH